MFKVTLMPGTSLLRDAAKRLFAGRIKTLLAGQTSIVFAMAVLATGNFSAAIAQTDPLLPENHPEGNDGPFRYAIYSTAWSVSSNAGLRIMAQNQSEQPVTLVSIAFIDEPGEEAGNAVLELDLRIPPLGWAEADTPYLDLLSGNQCVRRTLNENWRLVEISNYTLNPSVRGLIIENTETFRIFQCVRPVRTTWTDAGQTRQQNQWVMYHFERKPFD